MNEQPTFADLDYQHKRRRTKSFWSVLPDSLATAGRSHWAALFSVGTGAAALSLMLRVHIVQLCLAVPESVRRFAGLRLSEPIPDESTILHFRHLLERHELGQGLFEEIKSHLEDQGVRLREGTIVEGTIDLDATIIEAPSSTKNGLGSETRRCGR